ncbi:M48 family metallopeptidase [Candidatus Avelusimicrobium alvi]|uniref:M48 family metallopeptidase n=1 Tax=Candidatus Avelusimicrobium alvi TaxID=3416221 RepID=UPI003D0BE7A0
MADTQSVISDVKLFIERLKKELPEVFGKPDAAAASSGAPETPAEGNKVLYNGDLFEARMYLTPDQEEGVAFDGTVFHVYLQSKESDPAALVTAWLRAKANETLKAKTKEWADKIGVEFNNIVIKDQRTCWASCSGKKNINYSYRIVKMPLAVQDYLMVHELCHLVHMNHGQEYWELVAQFCPDYKHHRRWLNDNKGSIFADVELTYREEPETDETQTSAPDETANIPSPADGPAAPADDAPADSHE